MTHALNGPAGLRLPRPIRALARRWPLFVAVACAVVSWGIDVVTAGQLLPVLPLIYVIMATIRRRQVTWIVLIVSVPGFSLLGAQPWIDPTVGILSVAAAMVLTGALAHTGRREVWIQTVGMIIFAGVAVLGLTVAPEIGRVVLAVGWFGHGIWDLWHLRRDRVVSRSYAEWCGVLDILMAVQLVLA